MEYKRLTKMTEENGHTMAVCAFCGTSECPLHNKECDGKHLCEMMQEMICTQLCAFENIYDEVDGK